MEHLFDQIMASMPESASPGSVIGHSRQGRAILAWRLGEGSFRISLVAGCHADEPAGPRLLRHLVTFLGGCAPDSTLLKRFQWWIVPHANPDGEARNQGWQRRLGEQADIAQYLMHFEREPPGDDIEFGFPRHPEDRDARPENRSLFRWWLEAQAPFDLHLSLHGMAVGAGPWFLVDPAWSGRCGELRSACRCRAERLGYLLHDVDRQGEKGFHRLEAGFSTRPSSRAMARHFLELGEDATAHKFRPSSMEVIRAQGGDPLTLVSEMPLFLLPDIGRKALPPGAHDAAWGERLQHWQQELKERPECSEEIQREAHCAGLRGMPFSDQLRLQWTLIVAGVEQVWNRSRGGRGSSQPLLD